MLGKLVQVLQAGGRVNRSTYIKRRSARRYRARARDGGARDAIARAVTEFHNPSGWVVTPRVGFFNYPNQVTGLKDNALRACVQGTVLQTDDVHLR